MLSSYVTNNAFVTTVIATFGGPLWRSGTAVSVSGRFGPKADANQRNPPEDQLLRTIHEAFQSVNAGGIIVLKSAT